MTLTTLRPNATDYLTGAVVGAATAHAALSDNSDASYADGAAGTQMGTVAMAGGVTKAMTVRVRSRSATGGGNVYADAFDPVKGVTLASVVSTITTTLATFTGAAAAVSLYQTDLDVLTFRFSETESSSNTNTRAYEGYVDLVWVARPVVAVTPVAPDPYTAATLVPVSWVNTLDVDGGAQTRYHVKVFTAAQYSVGGFDPETSPSTFDSGATLGSITTLNVGPLPPSATVRAYVKVAQTVNSQAHWSAWAFDQFVVNVPTPVVAAVTAVADDALARIVVTVDRNTGFPAWELVEVQRSVDGGTTWEYVRGARDIADTTDQFIVADYEVGNGAAVIYRARATDVNVSNQRLTGVWVTSTSTSWSSTATWLKDPDLPDRNLRVRLAVVPQLTRPRPQVVHRVVNSPSSVVISDVLGKRVGTIVLLTTTLDEAAALETLLSQATLLLQTPDSHGVGSMYVTCGDVTPERVSRLITDPHRRWAIPVIEVLAPADPTAGT
jgi:hypothetical protein